MAIPKFYLEKRKDKDGNLVVKDVPILMFYSFGSGRLQYYTGQRVDSKNYLEKYWTKGKPPIKSAAPGSSNIINYLDILASDVVNFHNQLRMSGKPVNATVLREMLDEKHKPKASKPGVGYDLLSYAKFVLKGREAGDRLVQVGKNKGKRFRPNGLKQHHSFISALERFMKDRKIKSLSFDMVDRKFYESFRSFALVQEKAEISTFATHVKVIKTLMSEAKEDGLHSNDSHRANYFVIPSFDSDTISVDKKYLKQVEKLDLSGRIALDNARDLFLIGCYSALRFSDFTNLKIEDFYGNFIRIRQIKTGEMVTIPVMKKMKRIIKKHDGLPRPISNQKFNFYIKEVFKLAGLTHLVKIRKTKGGVESYEEIEYHKLVSSHTARRTYATNMFKAGVPVMLIMAVTGHKTESAFLRYIRATNEDKARMMADMMEKLGL